MWQVGEEERGVEGFGKETRRKETTVLGIPRHSWE
jgi:hypothetical protein